MARLRTIAGRRITEAAEISAWERRLLGREGCLRVRQVLLRSPLRPAKSRAPRACGGICTMVL